MKYLDALTQANDFVDLMMKKPTNERGYPTDGYPVPKTWQERSQAVKEIADRLMNEVGREAEMALVIESVRPALAILAKDTDPYGRMNAFLDALPNMIRQAIDAYDNAHMTAEPMPDYLARVVREKVPDMKWRPMPTLTELTDWIEQSGFTNHNYAESTGLAGDVLGKLQDK